jgi:hypothetical protein
MFNYYIGFRLFGFTVGNENVFVKSTPFREASLAGFDVDTWTSVEEALVASGTDAEGGVCSSF